MTFYKTQDSNDWVDHTFKVQTSYARVIAVTAGAPPATVSVGALDLKALPAAAAAALSNRAPGHAHRQDTSRGRQGRAGGDLVAVLPGRYDGFTIGDKADAGDESYIHFKALGAPGEVVITTASPDDPNWMILLLAAHHVIVEGFNVAGSNQPGKVPEGPNAGIMINGNFVRSTKMAHHIALVGNFSHNHKKWGFTASIATPCSCRTTSLPSRRWSTRPMCPTGRTTTSFAATSSSAAPRAGSSATSTRSPRWRSLKEHPALEGAPPYKLTREWALGILGMATEKFGPNAFPTGAGSTSSSKTT